MTSLANATLYLVLSLKATKPQALQQAYISFHFISCCVVSSVFSVFINVITLSAACLRALLPCSRRELKIPQKATPRIFNAFGNEAFSSSSFFFLPFHSCSPSSRKIGNNIGAYFAIRYYFIWLASLVELEQQNIATELLCTS